MAEKKEEPVSQSKSLSDSDSSNDNETNPRFKTSVEERRYNTIPGLAIATRSTKLFKGTRESNHGERTTMSESQRKQS